MAFERLGLSLYDFLRRSGYLPFQVNLVGAQRSAQRALVPVLLCAVLNISLHGAMHAWLAGLLNSAQKHRHVMFAFQLFSLMCNLQVRSCA